MKNVILNYKQLSQMHGGCYLCPIGIVYYCLTFWGGFVILIMWYKVRKLFTVADMELPIITLYLLEITQQFLISDTY